MRTANSKHEPCQRDNWRGFFLSTSKACPCRGPRRTPAMVTFPELTASTGIEGNEYGGMLGRGGETLLAPTKFLPSPAYPSPLQKCPQRVNLTLHAGLPPGRYAGMPLQTLNVRVVQGTADDSSTAGGCPVVIDEPVTTPSHGPSRAIDLANGPTPWLQPAVEPLH